MEELSESKVCVVCGRPVDVVVYPHKPRRWLDAVPVEATYHTADGSPACVVEVPACPA